MDECAADRYARLRLIPWWRQEILSEARVFVAGVGAVGNEVLKNLALLGVGHIYVLDKDTIELSNLTRSVLFRAGDVGRPKAEVAARAASEFSPDSRIMPLVADLADVGLGVLADCEVALGCLDSQYGRILLNRYAARLGIPLVQGALGDGTDVFKGVLSIFHAPQGPCFECRLRPGAAEAELSARLSRGGCGATEATAREVGAVPSTPTTSAIVAALMVQEAMKILHAPLRPEGLETWPEPAWGAFVSMATGVHETHRLQLKVRPDCPNHAPVARRELAGFDRTRPLAELWTRHGLAADAYVAVDQTLRAPVRCACGYQDAAWRATRDRLPLCPACEAALEVETAWYFQQEHPVTALSLEDLALAPGLPLRLLGEPEILLTWSGMGQEVALGS